MHRSPHSDIQFDPALVARYDKPGPRYTSYPTAPHFDTDFGDADLREQARRGNDEPIPRPMSLYVHVPFCWSPCFYCGCNRIITHDRGKADAYLLRLAREVEMMSPLFDRDREVRQLHLGGGTPNFLRPEQINELVDMSGRHFNLSRAADRDFSIELDPRFIEPDEVHALAAIGFNRVSLGVQDFDLDVQQAINRMQPVEQTLRIIEAARDSGMRSINVDLIYGLPKQNLEGFGQTLDTVIEARPSRLAVYSYAHMPQLFRAQRQIKVEDLCPAHTKLSLLALAVEKLGAAGYRYVGMDHFALPEDELCQALDSDNLHRNFMGYTTHADCELLGLGASAISQIGDSFSQNHRDLGVYQQQLDEGRLPLWRGLKLSADDRIRAELIQKLMCQGRIDIAAIESRYDIDFSDYFATALEALRPLEADELVEVSATRISATPRGRLLLRVIAACFDAYLDAAPEQPRYSRAV
ncbi:MAG: oxygen-independent coproporphyrinogen III oxidase [Xanthomonadales bacterium]|nr:oxygen-independent coproporphyrinogen III oxidase [Xanthomonadales bacterium]